MSARRWLVLVFSLLLVGVAVTLYALPELVRRVAVARIQAITERPVRIDRVDVDLLQGRVTIRGFHLAERDGQTPFADFAELDVRLRLPSLLLGHLWIRELVLTEPTVRVVRLPTSEFNFSDLIRRSGDTGRGGDVTVDRFVLRRGTVTLEDRALPVSRTWTSEDIAIEAHDLSTRRDDGRAVGTSVTAGAPVSVEVTDLRLYPIHLQARVTIEGADLTPAQVYLPPDTSVVLERGRATTSVTLALDAREGLRADGTARIEDVALRRADGGDLVAVVPGLTAQVSDFALREKDLRLGQLAVEGTMTVRDPSPPQAGRFRVASVRASVADLTWPATTPGRLDLVSTVQGGGTLRLTGMLRPPPAATQLRLRLARVDLAPWTQFLPLDGRISGQAEADLHMNEPLGAGIPARVQGKVAVNRLGVARAQQRLLAARRIEASGLALHWPTRLVVERVQVSEPRATVERDREGGFPLENLVVDRRDAAAPAPAAPPPLTVDIGEIVVRGGVVSWRDQAVSPPARLDVSSIDARVSGIGWPLRGPAAVRVALQPPGGGQLRVTGRVELDPVAADLRVTARNAELAPYQPYLPTPAGIAGAADLDVALVVPSLADRRATARGSVGLSRLDVRDRERTVMRVERASATGLEVDWPQRVHVGRLALTRPWILIERDEEGALPLRRLLSGPSGAGAATPTTERTENGGEPVAIAVARLSVERGGVRVVDRAVSPAFAVDFQPATLQAHGLSTAPARPARVEVAGQLGPGAELALSGTIGALGGPLQLDVRGELREFAMPRTNPYLLEHAGWKTTEGRLTSTLECRIEGDALSARTDIRVSRLQLVRAAEHDGAQARIGLPLRMLTALMKDRHGDITLSLPVGGSLRDPRFDLGEVIWGAVRTVAINAITLPVSWIGRVHFSPDSRIERIEVDPVPFEPGTSDLTPEGRARVARLVAFLEQLPEVRMALTPVISSRDVEAVRRRNLQAALDRAAREGQRPDEAAARLFAQRFPGQPAPGTLEATLAALLEGEPPPTAEIDDLAARRLEAIRATVERAGIDDDRMAERKPVQRDDADSQVALDVLDPETPRPSKIRSVLRRLGVPVEDPEASK